MTKFYQVTNAARPIEVGGKKFVFEPTEFFPASNSHWGTYATEDEADMALLDEMVATGRIFALTEKEYDQSEVKKNSLGTSPSLIGLKAWHAPQTLVRGPVGPAVTVAPESVEEALMTRLPVKTMKNVTPPKK